MNYISSPTYTRIFRSARSLRLPGVVAACALISARLLGQADYSPPYTFTTIAGTPPGYVDGTGSAARFNAPGAGSVAIDGSGNIYVADSLNQVIRKITPAGVVSTLAGTPGVSGYVDAAGGAAQFSTPTGIAVDGNGNVYVSDQNEVIRKITPAGVVTTLAGGGYGHTQDYGYANGQGNAAQFEFPQGIALDGAGNVYVADTNNHAVRKITPTGAVSTLAGGPSSPAFAGPSAVAVDAAGNVYVLDNSVIDIVTQAGSASLLAGNGGGWRDDVGANAQFNSPQGIAIDGSGNLYVADKGNNAIRMVAMPGAIVTTLAGTPGSGGNSDGTGSAAQFNGPEGIAIDGSGNIYVADSNNSTIRKVSLAGVVTTFAGAPTTGNTDGPGATAQFSSPLGIIADGAGNIFVADANNQTIREITPQGVVSTFAGTAGVTGLRDGTGIAAQFNHPWALAFDASGNLYVGDAYNGAIRVITPDGVVTTLAGGGGWGSADGPGSAAEFSQIAGLAVDSSGNVYVSDIWNSTIRKITPQGVVTTLAGIVGTYGFIDGAGTNAEFGFPSALAIDAEGNLCVLDTYNFAIRKVSPAGVVSTFAAGTWGAVDGPVGLANIQSPFGLSIDSSGNLYVADTANCEIRLVTPGGYVTTLAGSSGVFGGVDGTGVAAQFSNPMGIFVDGSGQIYVADSSNNTIRLGTSASAPVFVQQPEPMQSVASGANAVVSASAAGLDVGYQWNFNGGAIQGATGPSLTIAGFVPTDTGSYTVTATNARGSVSSAAGLLTTIAPPAITASPSSVTTAPGAPVSFSVAASGAGALTYQWLKFGAPISGATSSTLSFPSVAATDSGSYTVLVANSGGSTASGEADLVVSGPAGLVYSAISFDSFPTGPSALLPAFTLVEHGTTFVSYGASDPLVGVVGGTALGAGNAGYIGGSGTTSLFNLLSTSLDVSLFPGAATGNTVDVASSDNPEVQLDIDFSITRSEGANQQSFDFEIYDSAYARIPYFISANSTVSNFVSEPNSFPNYPTMIGYHSIVGVNPSNEVFIQDNTDSLQIDTGVSITPNDAYHLQTTVNYQSATWSATLKDTTSSQSFTLASNRPINVSGYVLSGMTPLSDGWANVDSNVGVVSSGNKTLSDRLVFNNYTVTQLVSTPAPPVILTAPVNSTATPGGSVTLSVSASGSPAPAYHWFLNGAELTDGIQQDGSTVAGSGTSSLTISGLQSDENGANFTVAVANTMGTATSGAATLVFSAANGSQLYTVADLGSLGGDKTIGTGINSAGTVVGYSYRVHDAGLYAFSYADGMMSDLGALAGDYGSEAFGINSTGTIVGHTEDANNGQPFSYADGMMSDLNLSIGVGVGSAVAVNDPGTIVGSAQNSHGFSFSGGVTNDLGTLGGNTSYAHAINNAGVIVGWADVSPGSQQQHAFSYGSGAMTDLGTLGGLNSYAYGINHAGAIVGTSYLAGNGGQHAFTCTGETMTDLGSLGGNGGNFSLAEAISDSGTIVGQSNTTNNSGSNYDAIVCSNGEMSDLNALVDLPGVSLDNAVAVNASGQIVANGTNNHAYLLTPIPGAGAPQIAQQPVSQQSVTGSGASFSVSVSGQNLSYQWFLNGVALSDGAQADGSVIFGSSTASLSISDLQADENGAGLSVVVSNSVGAVTSSLATLGVAAPATGQLYSVVSLGTLGGSQSYATGLNTAGTVVGYSTTAGDAAKHAFSYAGGVMMDLGTLGGVNSYAFGINSGGTIVGNAGLSNIFSNGWAFSYSDGSMSPLDSLPEGNNDAQALAINDPGVIVGSSFVIPQGFINTDGVVTLVPLLPGGTNSDPTAINNLGAIVGGANAAAGAQYAFLYSDGVMTSLGGLAGSNFSSATGINNGGTVVGYSNNGNTGFYDGFIYSNGVMTSLRTLGGDRSYAAGINDAGFIVGWSNVPSGGQDAIVYSGGLMTDLNSVVDLQGVTLTQADAVNSVGQIVAQGSDGQAYLLTPTPDAVDTLGSGSNWAVDFLATQGNSSLVFQTGELDYIASNSDSGEYAQVFPVPGANGGQMVYGAGGSNALVGSTAADWTSQVNIDTGSLNLAPGQGFTISLSIANLQDAHYDNGQYVYLKVNPSGQGLVAGSFTWGNNLTVPDVAIAATSVTVRASYSSSFHTLTAAYSADGGSTWNTLLSFDVTQTNANGGWGMGVTSAPSFGVSLLGMSYNPNGSGPSIGPGQVYFKDFADAGLTLGNWPQYVPPPGAPTIAQQPAPETGNLLGNASFTVGTTDSGDTYQWFLNGVALADGTQADGSIVSGSSTVNLLISNLQGDENLGSLTVALTNGNGTTTSSAATLLVVASPAITTDPEGLSDVSGARIGLAAGASGLPAPTYQWQLNGVAVQGATSAAYTFSLSAATAGNYTVVATNLYGSATSGIAPVVLGPGYAFTTLAGKAGLSGSANGTGAAARFDFPSANAAVDLGGNLYVADTDNHTIRKITLAGAVTTLAGTAGAPGFSDGTGAVARFNQPFAVAIDSSGNLYVADNNNCDIRLVTPAGVVTTIAGSPQNPGSADGAGAAARFNFPLGIAVDPQGNVFVADTFNNTIREIVPTVSGGVKTWTVTTIAGTAGVQGFANGAGASAQFSNPYSLAVDANDNLYVADTNYAVIRQITPTIAGGATIWNVATIGGVAGVGGAVDGFGAGSLFGNVGGIAADGEGNVFVADTTNQAIRELSPTVVSGLTSWTVTTIAGKSGTPGSTNGSGSSAEFCLPGGVAVDAVGNIYVSDSVNDVIRKGTPPGSTGAPVITEQPQSLTVNAGSNVTLTVMAIGNPTLKYQWYLNGAALSGKTKDVLSLSNVKAASAGTYTVTVSNTSGSVTSAPATLTVDVAPVITTQPVAQTVNQGATVTFTVVATGLPTPSYQWYWNGSAVGGATSSTLTLIAVQPGAGGTYVVAVKNVVGMVNSKAVILTVDTPPVITAQPLSQTVVAGVSVSFSVAVTGLPAPKYQWSLGGAALSGATKATLTIADPKAANAGTYTVTATNALGMVTSSPATLTVIVPPAITTQPKSQTVTAGSAVTFSVVATGTPTLLYQWTFDGIPIPGAASSSFSLTNVQAAAAGNYSVTVTNSGGNVTSKAAVLNVK